MGKVLRALPVLLAPLYAYAQPAAAGSTAQQQVLKIFVTSCVSCHSGKTAAGGLLLDSFEGLATGGSSGAAVLPGNSAGSNLFKRITTTDRALRMPPTGAALPPDQIHALQTWIDGGAEGLPAATAVAKGHVEFARDVEPILRASCYPCHSGTRPKSGLRLDAKATAMKGGVGGEAIQPGNSSASRLIARVEGKGGEPRMPLGSSLTPQQIGILRSWIDSGADWPDNGQPKEALIEKHWAYRAPVLPAIPKVNGPVRNPIDNFVLARLAKEGMTFSAPASKEKLIRRVFLDLTGLPPTPEDVDSFVKDTRPDAYERVVDKLLASPAFGERWARPWLDYARYADTNGYEADFRRTMWKYRDWVINALNRDMPFDQFTIEQLAGDLLPGATTDQKIATGFHRNTMLNEEGGVDKDQSHFEVLVDRVNTTATVWLGSTIGCSQCHNHKYDPFTQKEYYQMMAFFSSGAKKAIANGGSSTKYEEPILELPTPEQEQKRAELKRRTAELETRLKTSTPKLEAEQAEWERYILRSASDWSPILPDKLAALEGTRLESKPDGVILSSGSNPREQSYTVEAKSGSRTLSAIRLEALPNAALPRGGPGRDIYGNFILTEMLVEVNQGSGWEPVPAKRYLVDDGRLQEKKSKHLWRIDASREDERVPRQIVAILDRTLSLPASARLRITLRQNSDLIGQSIGCFRLSTTGVEDPSWVVQIPAKNRRILQAAQRTADDQKILAEYFRSVAPSLQADRDELKGLKKDLDDLKIATALILGEEPGIERPSDFVRTRGVFSAKADPVQANVPAALGSLPPGQPVNRLALAKWIVSRENPLTARVAVNRIWEQYFGHGIVETSEDFGSQGQRPTHPELLDWLAIQFMDSGWHMKAMHRLIVTSAAYRQTSEVTPELLRRDPANKLLSRAPRVRMEAEMVRDTTLAVSGLLVRKVGGPSVFPPQPPGIWDLPYNDDSWVESKGPDRYRRGLYTFLRRSAPYPAMMNFDATSREFCTVRRTRTNTPLQALTTLNDRAFFETAQALGRRLQAEGGSTDRDRVNYGFRLCAGRAAQPQELDRILDWEKAERQYFSERKGEAAALAHDAENPVEQSVWTMLANVLLNLDETLTKE